MASYNRVVIVGNLTRDVELRYTPGGTAVTDIALAVNDRVKKNEQWVDEVNFFDVTLWGRTAVGEKMQMLSSRNSGGAGGQPSRPHTSTEATPTPAQSAPQQSAPPNDEVPF